MPVGNRRNPNKTSGIPKPSTFVSANTETRCGSPTIGDFLTAKTVYPKHFPIPNLQPENAVIFELTMFVFTAMASFLQFLHMYRSVWWLPQSYTRYTMNFYLIDPYLVGFITTILGRRFVYAILNDIVTRFTPAALWPLLQKILTLVLLFIVMISLIFCTYHIMKHHPVVNIFYLCYPLSVYFILFGVSVSPFFDVSSFPVSSKDKKAKYAIGRPMHNCSSSPYSIRDEVDCLKTDFNLRMKQVLFSSVLNAYYSGFVPCCFAQSSLYYDAYWATQHLALVWMGSFTMHSAQCYPPSYCDTLHRAALHLGRWVKVQGRNQHLPTHMWDDGTLWTQGALVRHCKDLYRAEGIVTAAEPGNSMHGRFYAVFNNPAALVCGLLGLQSALVLLQLEALIRASEWHQILSATLLLFANYYMLFKFARDYFICCRIYRAEQLIQEKVPG